MKHEAELELKERQVKRLLENANIKDIAPTVAALLGVEAAPEWEGKVLYNEG